VAKLDTETDETTDTKDENLRTNVESQGFWQKARFMLEQYRAQSTTFLKVGKLKWDSTTCQRERSELYRRLGEKAYQLLNEGRFEPSDVQQLVAKINDLTNRIDKHQTAIQDMAQNQWPSQDSSDKTLDGDTF